MVDADFSLADGRATVELQRPEALNAVDLETKRAIVDQLREWKGDERVRAVLVRSEGEAFCAGGDVHEVREHDYALRPFTDSWAELFDEMTSLDVPTVARVDGYALGGGFDLVLHTDIAVAAADAHLAQPEVGLGIVNHFSPPRLVASLGRQTATDLLLTGRALTGREADRAGLVARSVEGEDLDDEVDAVVEALLEKSPRVLRKLKAGLWTTQDMSPSAAESHLESVALEAAREDPDYREGVAAQLEDREPEWE